MDLRSRTVDTFRERLLDVIARSGGTRSAFAARCGLDRSTLSQILSDQAGRLPRVETLVAIGGAASVSVDWLLGLSSDGGPISADLVEQADVEFAGGPRPEDETLARWRAEASGYKIRYVPTVLPDPLKTRAVLDYEFRGSEVAGPEERAAGTETQLAYERLPETDTEVCSSIQSLQMLARGEGVWRQLPLTDRREQLEHMGSLLDELYPTFRWFLFDGRERYAAPMTVFGPQRAALYLGERYLVLNSRDAVRALTRHFDSLIRSAVVQPHEVGQRLRDWAEAAR
jgi:transcriptional regulator with XRE-family HTH domain